MKKNWKELRSQACGYYHKCDGKLQEAVYYLMIEKGFSDKVAKMFRCDFTSGTETVISFEQQGEMADLDLDVASMMTREEIIERLGRYMDDRTRCKMLD